MTLIEKEFMNQLKHILSYQIYQKLQEIYDTIITFKNTEYPLKEFQLVLKDIINWNDETIDYETLKIISSPYITGKCSNIQGNTEYLNNLIKAIVKLYYDKISPCLDPVDISLEKVIHKIYIEVAISFWSNPYLFYHDYCPLDLKRNRHEALTIIKDCIHRGLVNCMPLNNMLIEYINFDKNKKIINEIIEKTDNDNDGIILKSNTHVIGDNLNYEKSFKEFFEKDNSSKEEKQVEQVLEVPPTKSKLVEHKSSNEINVFIENIKEEEPIENPEFFVEKIEDINDNDIFIKNIKEEEPPNIENKIVDDNSPTLPSKIQSILHDLGMESEVITPVKDNTKYRDIFSNSFIFT